MLNPAKERFEVHEVRAQDADRGFQMMPRLNGQPRFVHFQSTDEFPQPPAKDFSGLKLLCARSRLREVVLRGFRLLEALFNFDRYHFLKVTQDATIQPGREWGDKPDSRASNAPALLM